MPLTPDGIREILQSGDFSQFIGEPESGILDAKEQPYNLRGDGGKYDLAKDVSSFANADGGFIIIGLKTEPGKTLKSEVINEIRSLSSDLIDLTQYDDILASWLYPVPKCTTHWHPSRNDPDKGLFAIEVPAQSEADKPFPIARQLREDGKRTEVAFGFAERRQESSQPASVQEMYQYFRDGKRFAELIQRGFEEVKGVIGGRERNHHATGWSPPDAASIISRAVTDAALSESRVLALAAYPLGPTELKTTFQSGPDTIRYALENPPRVRGRGGWDLYAGPQSRIVEGTLLRCVTEGHKVVDLYRTGALVFAAVVDGGFYCWAQDDPARIHPLALAEAMYNFVLFYQRVVSDMTTPQAKHKICVNLTNFLKDGTAVRLAPGVPDHWSSLYTHEAPKDSWSKEVEFGTDAVRETGLAAFEMLREIYYWFGMSEQEIPYQKQDGGRSLIDPTRFPRGA
jgi:hypothetical protein